MYLSFLFPAVVPLGQVQLDPGQDLPPGCLMSRAPARAEGSQRAALCQLGSQGGGRSSGRGTGCQLTELLQVW